MNTGEAVRAVRDKLGESQQTFSNRVGATLMTVSRWERNVLTPKPATLAVLAHLARELNLNDAAAVLDRECGLLFQAIGPRMLQTAWEYFYRIKSNIAEFGFEARAQGLGKDIPKDLWDKLDAAITAATEGEHTIEQLRAMNPHVGPQESTS